MSSNLKQSVAIFWDYENCPLTSNSSGYEIVDNIRRMGHEFGNITLFKAYFETTTVPSSVSQASQASLKLRSELQSSGVSLTECPNNNRTDAAKDMVLVDMLTHAIDNPAPATVVLISGDPTFAYAVSVLRHRRYRVVVIAPPNIHTSLKSQASALVDWNCDILGKNNAELNTTPPLATGGGSVPPTDLEQNTPFTFFSHSHSSLPRVAVGDKRMDHTARSSASHENGKSQHNAKVGISNQRVSSWLGNDSCAPGPSLSSKRLVPLQSTAPNDNFTPSILPSLRNQFSSEPITAGHPSGVLGRLPPHLTSVVGNYGRFEPKGRSVTAGMAWNSESSTMPRVEKPIPGVLKHTRIPSAGAILSMAESRAEFGVSTPPKPSSFINHAVMSRGDSDVAGPQPSENGDTTSVLIGNTPAVGEPVQQRIGTGSPNGEDLQPDVKPSSDETFIMPEMTISSAVSLSRASSFSTSATVRTSPSAHEPPPFPVPSHHGDKTVDETTNHIPAPPTAPAISSVETEQSDNLNAPTSSGSAFPETLPVGSASQINIYPALPTSPTLTATKSSSVPQTPGSATSNLDCIMGKSVEGTSEKLPAPEFNILVEQLDQQLQKGVSRPLRSAIAENLSKQDPAVYARAGVSKFRQYISLACKAGIIIIGGVDGKDWVSLNPALQHVQLGSKGVEVTPSLRESVDQAGDDTVSRQALSGKTTPIAETVYHQPSFETSLDGTTDSGATNPGSSSVVAKNTLLPDSNSSIAAAEKSVPLASPEASTHPTFLILVEILRQHRTRGCSRSSRSNVAIELVSRDPLYTKRAGVSKFKEYIALAVKAQVVLIGHTDGEPWISLHPAGQGTEASSANETAPLLSSTSSLSSRFQLLVEQLEKAKLSGAERPLRSAIGFALLGQNKSVYQDAGFDTFKEYVAAAAEVGVVQLGGSDGHAWISLCPA